MKNIKTWCNKSKFAAAAVALAATLCVGLTIAYFTDIETAVNQILVGSVEIETNEKVEGIIKTDIGMTSTGKSESYVRMRVDIPDITYSYTVTENGTEITKKGQVLIQTCAASPSELTAETWKTKTCLPAKVMRVPASGGTATEEAGHKWYKLDDGFWYLSTTLNTGDTAEIIKSLTYPGVWDSSKNGGKGGMVDPLPLGLTLDMLTIPITSEAVQVANLDVSSAGAGETDSQKKASLQAKEAFILVNQSGQRGSN